MYKKEEKIKKKLLAFTLAEVLITLAIIGVVAALTIPNLLLNAIGNKYVRQARITQNMLTKILQTSMSSVYGTAENFPATDSVEFYETLEEFLPPIKEKAGPASNVDLPTPYWRVAHGSTVPHGTVYELLDGTIITFFTFYNSVQGMGAYVSMDVNGRDLPNVLGKDIFYMSFATQEELIKKNPTLSFAYGQLKPLGWDRSDEDVRKYCYLDKGNYNRTAPLSKSLAWTRYPGNAYMHVVGSNSGRYCLEYLNRLNWNLSKYPIKKFNNVEE